MKKVKRSLLPKAFIAEGFYCRRLLSLPVFIAALLIFAASCGQTAPKQQSEEAQQTTDAALQDEASPNNTTLAYVKFDGNTLLVDEFVWVMWNDTEAIERYGLTEDDMDDDYHIVNEVEEFEEWKLLPSATFTIIRYIESEEGYSQPRSVEVSRAEFSEHIAQYDDYFPPMRITGNRSSVSRIEEMYVP